MRIILFLLFISLTNKVICQNVTEHYNFNLQGDTISYFIKNEDLLIKREKSLVKGEKLYLKIGKPSESQKIIFSYKDNARDSLLSQPGYSFPDFFYYNDDYQFFEKSFYYLASKNNESCCLIEFPISMNRPPN